MTLATPQAATATLHARPHYSAERLELAELEQPKQNQQAAHRPGAKGSAGRGPQPKCGTLSMLLWCSRGGSAGMGPAAAPALPGSLKC